MTIDVAETELPAVLDDLSRAEIEALPFAVVQVDGAGRVMLHNRAEHLFAGRAGEPTLGRDFFREVAPSAHVPAFHGRFLDGVRAGRLDAAFGFVLRSERVQVRMSSGREPDRYWIVMRQLGPRGSRDGSAAARITVNQRRNADPVDPGICEREPIRSPGAIQPHAALIALDPDSLVVTACSDNVRETIGLPTEAVLGRALGDLLPADTADALIRHLRDADAGPMPPWRGEARLGPERQRYALVAHRHDGRILVEFEIIAGQPEDYATATPFQAQAAIANMRQAGSLDEAARTCARDLRAITGFERVLVYCFDADWNGQAIGESRDLGYRSLLDLRFPASDIPAQARALYAHAPARFVVDRDATPAAIRTNDGRTLDLGFAQSRALSPVHLEYQRNLGVDGSMSISIVVQGALWGLMIGHHRRPHYVTPETRAIAELVTDAFALRVHELATTQAWREQQSSLERQNALLRRLAGADSLVATLTAPASSGEATLLDPFGASGAAIVIGGRIATIGPTPSEPQIADIAAWLRQGPLATQPSFATDALSTAWAGGERCRETAAGVLAAAAGGDGQDLLLWFRREVASTIAWGGDPNKTVLAGAAAGSVLPRRSFERYMEVRRGRAEPWAPWHAAAAATFAAGVEGVVLRQVRKIDELAAKQRELTALLAQQEVLTREIDHRVKNSLQVVANMLLMQASRVAGDETKRALKDAYARVIGIARVHDSLRHAETADAIDVGDTLRRLSADLVTNMADASHPIDLTTDGGLVVSSRTAVALATIVVELVTNALRHAYRDGESGPIGIDVRGHDGGGLVLRVCDEGRALPSDWDHPRPGSGKMGMRVIAAMVQQIGARLTVDALDPGKCFTVTA